MSTRPEGTDAREAHSALVVVDMQVGCVSGPPGLHEPARLLRTIAELLARARAASTVVVFVQHGGPPGHRMAKGSAGWEIHPDLAPQADELVVHKRECDAFHETELDRALQQRGVRRVVVCGAMTQYCIDTTVRRAFSLGYGVTLVADARSTADTQHLSARPIILHHNDALDDFGCLADTVRVRPVREVSFVDGV
jgi:nicotinamidase-related amidase